MPDLATNLKALMIESNLSQKELAEKAGLSYFTVQNILLKKVKDPPISKMIMLADALGVSVKYILEGYDENIKDIIELDDLELYSKIIKLTIEKCKALDLVIANTDSEYRKKITRVADSVYRHALFFNKLDENIIDVFLEEEIYGYVESDLREA